MKSLLNNRVLKRQNISSFMFLSGLHVTKRETDLQRG